VASSANRRPALLDLAGGAAVEPAADRIIRRQDAAIAEQQHGRGGELLADGGDLEPGAERALGVRAGPGRSPSDRYQVLAAALEEGHAAQDSRLRHGSTVTKPAEGYSLCSAYFGGAGE
jgi:hypothetical protein